MGEKEISRSDFITACCIVAAVLANGAWQQMGFARGPVEEQEQLRMSASAAMDIQSAGNFLWVWTNSVPRVSREQRIPPASDYRRPKAMAGEGSARGVEPNVESAIR